MRIISQNGLIDIPYDNTAFVITNEGFGIFAYTPHGQKYLMANYSTTEKAQEAMKKLHEIYTGSFVVENVEIPEETFEKMKEDIINAPLTIMVNDFENSKARIDELNNLVFQFPQDSEV